MNPESRRLSPDEFPLVAQVLALSISPPWQRFVLQVMYATGTGQGAKAAAILWRELPSGERIALTAVYDRFLSGEEWGRCRLASSG